MSAFSKSQLGGFDTTGPSQESNYSYAQPSFASPQHPVSLTTAPHAPNSQPLPLMGGTQYQVRSPYESQASPYIRQIPEIKSFKPIKGPDGTTIYVHLQSIYDFTALPSISFSLMFHSRRCDTVLRKTGQQGPLHQYTLSADVPPFSTTGWSEPQITVFMRMEDENGQLLGDAAVGDFTYMNTVPRASYSSTPATQINPRKRKGSAEPLDTMRSPAKRQASQQLRPKSGEEYPQYSYQPSGGSPYSPYMQNPSNQGQYQYVSGYGRPDHQNRYSQLASPRQFSQTYQFPASSAVQQPPIKALSPQTPWSPSTYHAVSQAGRSPAIAAQTRHVSAPLPAPTVTANPPLIRTSTLQQSPSPASTPAGAAQAGQQFNPYAMLYPHKAVLKINGDLDGLAENWSLEEWEAKRRIVQFWRHQNGSAIHTNFAPVAPNERPPNSICISCIWWEEKKECYVTSVDTIYLLESLVAVRFTVEEKNRIRRNLEGFRPLTVSKAKSDSEEFFKLIMAFPNPKPRNIEKDVKVFPWKILAHALKKIIGKYSASYSSTAGALLTPVNATSYGNGSSGAANSSEAGSNTADRNITASPRSASDSTSSIYAAGITTTSPSMKQQVDTQGRGGGPPDLRVTVPTVRASSISSAPAAWPQPHMHSAQSQQDINPSARVSWDFNSYIDTSPASATPGGSQTLHYQRGVGMPMPDHRESNLVPPPKSHQISGA